MSDFIDQTEAPELTKADLNKVCWRSMLLNTSFNYERMQAGGVIYSMLPALRKIHTNPDDLKKSLNLHSEFFNTNTFVPTFAFGLALAAERKKAAPDVIRSIKISAMAPMAGLGDSLLWATAIPIIAGIAASLVSHGNVFAPFFYLISFFVIQFSIRFGLMHFAYKNGTKAFANIKTVSAQLSRTATILGMTVIGGLMASYISISTPLTLDAGDMVVKLQSDLLDAVMPNLLPALVAITVFYAVKVKKIKPLVMIGAITALSILGAAVGIV